VKGKLKTSDKNPLAAAIRTAIGASPEEEIEFVTPQFTREPGAIDPSAPPASWDAWLALSSASRSELRERGLRPWGGFRLQPPDEWIEDDAAPTHEVWLFPGEWYHAIPLGLPVVGLHCEDDVFAGDSDDDIRFGCLAFGVRHANGGEK